MPAHAQLSPSKRSRWALCPGSIREEAKYPEQDSGPAAVDGTHTHTLLEQCIKLDKDASAFVGLLMADHEGEFLVDAPRAARVQVALDYIKSRKEVFLGMCDVVAETKVNPKWFLHRDDLSGTVDVWISGLGVLEIIDYKDGMGVVEAKGNLQLEQYAIGTLAESELGWNVPEQYPWQVVRMTIIQPKLALKGMNPISTWTATTKELLDRVPLLGQQARATDAPDAPLVPGESQCKYCRAKGSCAALAGNVMKEVGIMFQPVTQTLDIAQQSADKDPSAMSDAQIVQIMEAAPLMRQLLEGVEKEALRRLEAGQSIPGLKLVNGRGSRAWVLPEEQMAEKLIKMGIPKGAIYETKLVTPAKAEKLTWEKKDGTKMQLTDRQLKTMDGEYVVKLAGKLTVVPESDSRKAIDINAAPLFSAIEAAPAAEPLPSWLL
jgi:hypothetical protein